MAPSLVLNMRDTRPILSIPDWAIQEIRAATPHRLEFVLVDAPADGRGDGGGASAEAVGAVENAEIHIGFGFPEALFRAAQQGRDRLRWVHTGTAGVAAALHGGMRESAVMLTNSAGVHAEPMADTILASITHFARGLDFAVNAQHRRTWDTTHFYRIDSPVRELAGATVGILGYGGIGRAVARRVLALGMNVLAYRRRVKVEGDGIEQLAGREGLERVLEEADYLVLSLPSTPETVRILNSERIARLRSGAVVINVGRGEAIDETALAAALAEGRIRGAALDVFETEPLPTDSPLWSLPNALITPHVSAVTHDFWRREVDLILENLRRYESGAPLLNLVDKVAGY